MHSLANTLQLAYRYAFPSAVMAFVAGCVVVQFWAQLPTASWRGLWLGGGIVATCLGARAALRWQRGWRTEFLWAYGALLGLGAFALGIGWASEDRKSVV